FRGEERRFGWEAWTVQADRDWTVLRSLKRLLKCSDLSTRLELDGSQTPVIELATQLLAVLRQQLGTASTLSPGSAEALEVMIGVPANACSNQRFLTVEAFRAAGFEVLGLLNEPSAASVEYGHREKVHRTGVQRMLAYDLGGGTFDASLVDVDADEHI